MANHQSRVDDTRLQSHFGQADQEELAPPHEKGHVFGGQPLHNIEDRQRFRLKRDNPLRRVRFQSFV
jgi:hypothetical protein